MPPPLPVLASRRERRVVAAVDALTLAFTLPGLRSRDGHDLTAYFRTAVRTVDTPADLELFAEHFLAGRDAPAVEDVRARFAGPLGATAAAFVAALDAEAAVRQGGTLQTQLLKRGEAVGFGCGLVLSGPGELSLDSDTLRDDRRVHAARRRQLDAADHAARLAEKLAAAGPAHRLAVADQAALLPTLLAAVPPGRVLLAAGPNVVVLDADDAVRVIAIPDAVGPLRCVRDLHDGRFAVGGTTGVALLNSDFAVERVLPAGPAGGRGFNAVARLDDGSIAATHGELGLVVWTNAGTSARTLATPGPARGLLPLRDGDAAFAAAGVVCTTDGQSVTPVHDGPAVLALLDLDGHLLAVTTDGAFTPIACGAPGRRAAPDDNVAAEWKHRSAAGPAAPTAAAALITAGLRAVLIADARGVTCVTPDGDALGRVPLPGGCRMLAVAGGRIVAVAADRATVHVWDAATPETPPRSVHVLARTGHHVTDVIGSTVAGDAVLSS